MTSIDAIAAGLVVIGVGVTMSIAVVRPRRRTARRRDVGPIGRRLVTAPREPIKFPPGDTAMHTAMPAPVGDRGASTMLLARAVPPAHGARVMLGYASWDGRNGGHASAYRAQAEVIASECNRREVKLLELVREREPQRGRALERPGLGYALQSISAGDADGLVVAELSRVAHSAAELGKVLQWFLDHDARFIAIAEGLDTGEKSGRAVAGTIIEISRWERDRLVERTRNGMLAARRKGPPGVADYPQLQERIARMRADGLTLQAIAAQLNREGTPTIRGGAEWRPSSVQVAAGYRRPPAGRRSHPHRNGAGSQPSDGAL